MVQKVALGEADAGIVYQTDVTTAVAADVAVVEIPDDLNVIAVYPIAAVEGGPGASLAAEFVTYVLGPGQAVLREFGFLPP